MGRKIDSRKTRNRRAIDSQKGRKAEGLGNSHSTRAAEKFLSKLLAYSTMTWWEIA